MSSCSQVVDHSGEARDAGVANAEHEAADLRGILARAALRLVLAAPTLALDLPLKILVREDAEERVLDQLTNSVDYLRERYGVPAELAQKLAVLADLATAAAA